jgi:hypothetical protein
MYCVGNPVILIDPNGLAWKPTVDENNSPTGYEWIPEDQSYNNDGTLKSGLYHQAIFFSENGTFDPQGNYNIGSSTAYVYKADGTIETFDACTYPSDINSYPTIPEGMYEATVGMHNGSISSYIALKMRDIGTTDYKIELGYANPAHPDKTFIQGGDIHKAGKKNFTSMTSLGNPISAGCFLIDYNKWDDFINIFNNPDQRNNVIGISVSRSMSAPSNKNPLSSLLNNISFNPVYPQTQPDATRVNQIILPIK